MAALGGGAASSSPQGESLMGLMVKEKSSCLNESSAHRWINLLGGGCLTSDCDEQLLLTLSLNQTCKLQGLVIGLSRGAACPRTVKLFINQTEMGFDEAMERAPTQEFVITDSDKDRHEVQLAVVKWNRTDSITIFVQDNHGADVTTLTSVNLYGTTLMGTDVSKIKGC